MLELNKISKKYKKSSVLNNISHTFDTGVNLITGPSGVGKSTLLRLCATAEKPSAGAVTWQGKNVRKSLAAFRQILGYAPQKIEFPMDLTAKDFMSHIGALKGLTRKTSESQTVKLFGQLGLDQDIDKTIQAYSGGMCRRLGLAQAFLGKPECLVIDEPTAELDPVTAELVHALIFDAAKDSIVIMTTHLEQSLGGKTYKTLSLSRQGENSYAVCD